MRPAPKSKYLIWARASEYDRGERGVEEETWGLFLWDKRILENCLKKVENSNERGREGIYRYSLVWAAIKKGLYF